MFADLDREFQTPLNSLGDLGDLVLPSQACEQNGELVSADPSGRIAWPNRVLQAVRDGDQNLIPDCVAQGVVELFETVDVQIE